MLKQYEAIYSGDGLKWLKESPELREGQRVIVTVGLPGREGQGLEELEKAWDAARGAWGTGKSLDEIDGEIAAMRA